MCHSARAPLRLQMQLANPQPPIHPPLDLETDSHCIESARPPSLHPLQSTRSPLAPYFVKTERNQQKTYSKTTLLNPPTLHKSLPHPPTVPSTLDSNPAPRYARTFAAHSRPPAPTPSSYICHCCLSRRPPTAHLAVLPHARHPPARCAVLAGAPAERGSLRSRPLRRVCRQLPEARQQRWW